MTYLCRYHHPLSPRPQPTPTFKPTQREEKKKDKTHLKNFQNGTE